MSTAGITGLVTAITALVVAVTGLVAIFVKILPLLKSTHEIVNQQRTDMITYKNTLTGTLRSHGIDVPPDESLTPPPAEP